MEKVIFTRYTGNPNYRTPLDIFQELDHEFHFTMDPCPFSVNPKFDGLKIQWTGRVFVNPPYSEPALWIKKALCEKTEIVVMLLKADISTKWFHELILPNYFEIRAVKGRLTFNGKYPAPFPSMIVIFK